MPRHLISDAHEWINEIPTVPGYQLAKPLFQGNGLGSVSGERRPCWAWLYSAMKKWMLGVVIGGRLYLIDGHNWNTTTNILFLLMYYCYYSIIAIIALHSSLVQTIADGEFGWGGTFVTW